MKYKSSVFIYHHTITEEFNSGQNEIHSDSTQGALI